MMATNSSLPTRIQYQVQAELKAGEKQIWAGSPKPPGRSQRLGGALFLFLAAAIFAIIGNHNESRVAVNHRGFPIYIVPFLLLGLLILISPIITSALGAWSLYVVTDRRAIIFRGNRFSSASADSYTSDRLQEIGLVERDDQSGDLIFARYPGTNGSTSNRGFLRVENVRDVDQLIRDVLHGQRLSE
ncbi:MAG: hypothetical protein M3O30_10300 [Planctomycetota bacterium]|nr:hypothetical protein [Planctomycetota bacterium]